MTVFAKGLEAVKVPGLAHVKSVTMLGTVKKVDWEVEDGALEVELPDFAPGASPVEFAPTFKIVRAHL